MRRLFAVILMAWVGVSGLGAQDDEEEVFGDGGLVAEIQQSVGETSTVLLRSERVEIGGRFRFDASSSWQWDGAEGPFGATLIDDPLTLSLGLVVFLDARPTGTFRVFGKIDVSYPFTEAAGTRTFDEVFHVRELFSDFQFGDAVFLRAGKQTINWGVGYFFSPADLLNITEIDPEDPEAELEGPVALKIQVPLGPHNLYLYTVLGDADSVAELAVAPKAEFVIGGTEIGLGALYRKGYAPAAMATLSTSLGDFSLFAEGLLSYGSNRTFVVADAAEPLGVRTTTYERTLFPSGTAGFSYRYADDLDYFNVSISAQYLYNGEGYADPDFLKSNAVGVAALLLAGELSASDLRDSGRHYGAASAAWSGMFGSDLNLSCFWLGNLAASSGMVVPALTWKVTDDLDFTVKTSFAYGEQGDELSPNGDAVTLSVSANFGGGRF